MALIAAVAVTVAVMVGVEAETEHSESVFAIVVVLVVEVLVDEVAVAGSFAGEPEDVGVAPVEGAELAALAVAVAVHSERPESPVEHSEFDLDFVDTQDGSAVQDDMTEVAVVVFDSAAVEHEEDNRPASAAGEAQAGVQAR